MIKKVFTLVFLTACLSCYADWSEKVDLGNNPSLYDIFSVVANAEHGVERFVAVNFMEAQMNGDPAPYDDVQFRYDPEGGYFFEHLGDVDNGSGDGTWQTLQGKLWRYNPGKSGVGKTLLGTYLTDHSPQYEYRYLDFYEYDPATKVLSHVAKPFDVGYDDNELVYEIMGNGDIYVRHFGEDIYVLIWDGSQFRFLQPLSALPTNF